MFIEAGQIDHTGHANWINLIGEPIKSNIGEKYRHEDIVTREINKENKQALKKKPKKNKTTKREKMEGRELHKEEHKKAKLKKHTVGPRHESVLELLGFTRAW